MTTRVASLMVPWPGLLTSDPDKAMLQIYISLLEWLCLLPLLMSSIEGSSGPG